MHPNGEELLRGVLGTLATHVMPEVQTAHGQIQMALVLRLLGIAADEMDGGAQRLVEDNAALRELAGRGADALASAGDASVLANLNGSRLVRTTSGDSEVYPIHYGDIVKGGDTTTNHELEPGDIIYVPPGTSARIGFAMQVIFFPLQQILGLGGRGAADYFLY